VGEAGIFPLRLQIGNEALYKDNVDRTAAHDLVGDVNVAAARIMRLWTGHGF
jgi:hypothetical protein